MNYLTLANYQVTTATNGEELNDSFGNPCDLVLLDVMMPRISSSGSRFANKYGTVFAAELPVTPATAKNCVSDLVNGFSSGANDYLSHSLAMNFWPGSTSIWS